MGGGAHVFVLEVPDYKSAMLNICVHASEKVPLCRSLRPCIHGLIILIKTWSQTKQTWPRSKSWRCDFESSTVRKSAIFKSNSLRILIVPLFSLIKISSTSLIVSLHLLHIKKQVIFAHLINNLITTGIIHYNQHNKKKQNRENRW